MRVVRSFVALALLLVPSLASAAPPTDPPVEAHPPRAHAKHPPRTARVQKAEHKTCLKTAVEVVGASEASTFSLSKCDGAPAPLAIDQLSILARPGGAAKPKVTVDVLAKKSHGTEVAPGIRRIDPRLLERLESAVDHFRKPGATAKVLLVSGYRPKSAGSYHQSGRALDFRIDGVENEALVTFCKTLPDTGCGYYPNSSFVHLDVRDAGAGHVAWIDVSRPGEPPKYVASWPLPAEESAKAPALPPDEPRLAPAAMEAPMPRGRRLDRHPYFF
ncbi:MAG TPA: DUF882 domain-containing protein [Polyangiaceae bacterium]|jgi:hypothetical protein|nr:DUF882 domain-containing protein [Polyangiaceae bacterium]